LATCGRGNIVVFEFNVGKTVEDFTGSGAHVSMWTAEFREYMRYKERFHHSQNRRALLGDDVGD
jgi:hypothetical protein